MSDPAHPLPSTDAPAAAVSAPSAPDLESASAQEVLAHVLEHHHPSVALACSFQKEETVLLDMLLEIEPTARVFALDTHVLFPETYALWRDVERRYGITVEVFQGPTLAEQAAEHGDELWKRDPSLCCGLRKVGADWVARCPAWTRGSPGCGASSHPPELARRSSDGMRSTASGRQIR